MRSSRDSSQESPGCVPPARYLSCKNKRKTQNIRMSNSPIIIYNNATACAVRSDIFTNLFQRQRAIPYGHWVMRWAINMSMVSIWEEPARYLPNQMGSSVLVTGMTSVWLIGPVHEATWTRDNRQKVTFIPTRQCAPDDRVTMYRFPGCHNG